MTMEQSKHRNFILLATLLFLPFSCARERAYPSDNAARLNSYQNSPQAYRPYNKPRSGAYVNPYNNPPRNYNPYYDFDQYYVPPTRYRYIEQNNDGPNVQKF